MNDNVIPFRPRPPRIVFPDTPLTDPTPRAMTPDEVEERRQWDEEFEDETP